MSGRGLADRGATLRSTAQPAKRNATYADLDALPRGTKAHLVDGVLFVPPRPSVQHQKAETRLGSELDPKFSRGHDGPAGLGLRNPEPVDDELRSRPKARHACSVERLACQETSKARIEPFDAVEIDLPVMWTRAAEPIAE